jgi:hypothetical protein
MALGGFSRALDLSGLFGLGVGAAAQTGNLLFDRGQQLGSRLNFVAESGAGKLVAELGLVGVAVLLVGLVLLLELGRRNLTLLQDLPPALVHLHLGLVAFALANVPFFLAASGVYGDPFVLLLLSLALGSVLAVPLLVARARGLQLPSRTDAA